MAMTVIEDIKVPLSPALAGETVVAIGHAGHVHLIDAATGRRIWTQALAPHRDAAACEGQPVSVSIVDDLVLAGSMGHVFGLKLSDGAVLWHKEYRARGAGETSLAVGGPIGDYVARLES
jgi:outer membrane protein assembly factor BamB